MTASRASSLRRGCRTSKQQLAGVGLSSWRSVFSAVRPTPPAQALCQLCSTLVHTLPKSTAPPPLVRLSPFYYLANILSAHVDRGALWQQPDAAIAAAVDADSGAEHADPASRLCRLSSFAHAWGLAHVLRVASKEGEGPHGCGASS